MLWVAAAGSTNAVSKQILALQFYPSSYTFPVLGISTEIANPSFFSLLLYIGPIYIYGIILRHVNYILTNTCL